MTWTWWSVIGLMLLVAIFALEVRYRGWRRGALGFLRDLAHYAAWLTASLVASSLSGPAGPLYLFLVLIVWLSIRRTSLGAWLTPLAMLNFLVLQWLGVRLQAGFDSALLQGPMGRWWSQHAPRDGRIQWSLLRWVWPLTGWRPPAQGTR